MWEWESEPGDSDPAVNEASAAMAQQIIDAQKIELERRKEQEKIEERINALIDDRIARFDNVLKRSQLEIDQITQSLRHKRQLVNEEKRLAVLKEQAGAKEGDKAFEDHRRAAAALEAYNSTLEANKSAFLELEGVPESIKNEIKKAFEGDDIEEQEKALQKGKAGLDQFRQASKDTGKAFASMGAVIGISTDATQTGFGKALLSVVNFAQSAGSAKDKAMMFVRGLGSMLSPVNILGQMMSFLASSFKEIEQASIDVAKATGASRSEIEGIMVAAQGSALRQYGIEVKELGKAYGALRSELADFRTLDKAARTGIMETTAKFAKLGITEKQTTNITRMMRFEFGKGAAATQKAQNNLVNFTMAAKSMGVPITKATSNFEQFAGVVMGLGGEVEETILDLSKAAMRTGVSMDKMLNIAKKFNTFKTGADAAAELNAVFGTQISSMELMMNTAEAPQIIADALNQATGGFANMSRHQQLAAAKMLGFGDNVQLLQGYMEGMSAEDEAAAALARDHADAMAEMNKMVQQMTPTLVQLANQFKAAFIDSKAFQRILTMVIKNADAFIGVAATAAYMMGLMADNIGFITSAYILMKLAMFKVTVGAGAQATAMSLWTFITGGATAAGLGFGASLKALGAAMWAALGPWGLILGALAAIAAWFHFTQSPPLYLIAFTMALGIIALGAAMYFAGPAIYPVVLALAALAAAVALIFFSLGPLVEALGNLISTMVGNVPQLFGMAAALYAIGAGFGFLGIMALGASVGIMAGSIALLALAFSMKLGGISFEDLIAIGASVERMGKGLKDIGKGVGTLSAAGKKLFSDLGDKSLMINSDGANTTMVAGKGGMFMVMPSNISVDVNMDEAKISAPIVNVEVKIDGKELKSIIRKEIISTR